MTTSSSLTGRFAGLAANDLVAVLDAFAFVWIRLAQRTNLRGRLSDFLFANAGDDRRAQSPFGALHSDDAAVLFHFDAFRQLNRFLTNARHGNVLLTKPGRGLRRPRPCARHRGRKERPARSTQWPDRVRQGP